MYDCLLSILHNFYPKRTHFPESPSHIVLGQKLSVKGMQVSMEDGSVDVTWVDMTSYCRAFGGAQVAYRLRCLLRAFPEPLGNFCIFPMELLRTTQFKSSNEDFSNCFSNLQLQPS